MRRNIMAGWYWGLCLMVWAPPGATAQEPEEISYEGRSAKEWAADLKDKDPKVRRAAAEACYQIRPRPKALDSVLTEALKDPDMTVRLEVANTLADTQQESVLAVYREALKNKDVAIREQAAIYLGRMYRPPEGAVIALTKALQDSEMIVRLEAANSLYQISRYTYGARVFNEALKDKAPAVQKEWGRLFTEGMKDKSALARRRAAELWALMPWRSLARKLFPFSLGF